MTIKFLYMKFLGLLAVTFGFGYSLTSFYNFFEAILGTGITDGSANILIMSIGLVFPLFIFIFGVFFYFYADVYKDKKSISVLVSSNIIVIIGVLKILLNNSNIAKLFWIFKDLMGFTHISFAYIALIIGILLFYGRIKYKY